ncbi:immunoglobulin-like domain-containing protein [Bacillus sp. FJAT-26390]|uniref:immunoglobulin-like domain-containing protein n=1 Tax=Bacillus sp. FJAT-26390 TaxID=1743142 RepID=UPI0021000CC9|nr:immunoglobulin-like domain-containing protein [Bacillus sp. FJAT-26390]
MTLSCMLVLSGGFTFNRSSEAVFAAAGPETITFSSNEASLWNGGIAHDGEGSSFNIPGLNLEFYNISDTIGTLITKPLVHGHTESNDHFDALTTYDPSFTYDGWKGMGIKSADGSEFQINGFFYSNFGEVSPITITVEGYRNGTKVADTTFVASDVVSDYISKNVTLDSAFDNVDQVLLYSSNESWHGINNIIIDSAVIPAAAVTNAASAVTKSSAVLSGTVNDNGSNTSVSFDYGLTTSYGSNLAATVGGTISAGAGNTASSLTLSGLTPNTTYHYRVKAENGGGIAYGSDQSFTTNDLTDAEKVAAAKAALAVGYAGSDSAASVTSNVTLNTSGTNGTTVAWSSNATAVDATSGTVVRPSYTQGDATVTLTATISKGSATDTKTFTLTVVKLAQTNAEAVAEAKAALEVGYLGSDSAASVTSNVTLNTSGTSGTNVVWSSDSAAVDAANGTVLRPSYTQGDATVTLTATISKGGVTDTKTFTLTVVKLAQTNAEAVAEAKAALEVGYLGSDSAASVTSNVTLNTSGTSGTNVVWSSDSAAVDAANGTVLRPSYTQGDATVTLTATISKGGVTDTKTFTLKVVKLAQTNAEAVAEAKAALEVGYLGSDSAASVTSNVTLSENGLNGTDVVWSSSSAGAIKANGEVIRPSYTQGDATVTLTATINKGGAIATKTFVLNVVKLAQTDAEAVAEAKDAVVVGYAGIDSAASVTQNVVLDKSGANGTTVAWSSNATAVDAANGAVERPSYTQGDATVTLTATISKGSATATKTFTLTVVKLAQTNAEAVAEAKTALEVGYLGSDSAASVTSNVTLNTSGTSGTNVVWSSDSAAVDAVNGAVVRPSYTQGDATVTLTATISKGGVTDTKTFTLKVLKLAQTDAEAVAEAKGSVVVGYAGIDSEASVTQDVTLGKSGSSGTTVAWSSDSAAVNAVSGAVVRPSYTQGDATVTLTATISKGLVTDTKTFTLKVLKLAQTDAEAVAEAKGSVVVGYTGSESAASVTQNIVLDKSGTSGTTVAWSSDSAAVNAASGAVVRPSYEQGDATVTLTATISKGTATDTKTFTLTVKALPPMVSAQNNSLGADVYTITVGGSLSLQATGDRQSAAGIVDGEERYIPTAWASTEGGKAGSFILNGGSYKDVYETSTVGKYTVTAAFQKQIWNGTAWVNSGTADTKSIDVNVIAALTYILQPIGDQSLSNLTVGYAEGTQQTKSINVTNAGTGHLVNLATTLSGSHANAFAISQPLATTLNSGAPATSFTVKAKDGLAAGTYTATVTIKADNMTEVALTLTQVVNLPDAPANPQSLAAAGGDRQVVLNWNTVTGATYYNVYMSTASGQFSDDSVATVTGSTYTVQNLVNGTPYYFVVKAGNLGGLSAQSNQVNATPATAPTSSEGNNTPSQPSTSTDIEVLVNGKVEHAGTATTTKVNDQTVTTVVVDQKKLEEKLALEGQGAVVTIPVNTKSDVVIGELNGQMVKNMEGKQAVLEIKTDKAAYTLPAQLINIDAISKQLGASVSLQDIKLKIEIAAPQADMVKVVENAAEKGTFTLVVPPINFTVTSSYKGTNIEISTFNAYVERTIAVPDGFDPNKITTGIVVDPDGTVRHVPTKVVEKDGEFFVVINSLTNSTYSVVWHPIEFSDVSKHWAKNAVNDMGSRMIIDGTGDGMFSPDRDITRAEFAAIIVRGLGLKLESGASSFSDVKETAWYSKAINTAYKYNLINGFEDGTFKPNDKITREQAMVIISKAMSITDLKAKLPVQSATETLRPFADAAKASSWATASIADSVQSGVVSGRTSTTLAPKAFITRAEVAAIVNRLLQKSELI